MELSTPAIERLRLTPSDARPQTVDRKTRRFAARALSGQPIRRYDPVSRRDFELVFDMAGADLSRFNGGVAPLLDSHADAGVGSQLGAVRRAWIEGGALLAEVELSSRPRAEELLDDLERGIVRGVSIGVELLETRDERDREGKLARRVVTKWLPYELSLVSTPADAGAMILSMHGGQEMTSEQNQEKLFDAPAAAERARIMELQKIGKAARLSETLTMQHIEAGTPVEDFRKLALEEMAKRSEQFQPAPRIEMVRDHGDTRREGLTLALRHRLHGGELPEHARQYAFTRLSDAARECLRWRGERLVGMSDAHAVTLAMSRSDFPHILADVANKSLLDAYQAAPAALKQLCRVVSARDFKTKRALRIGEGTGLALKAEAAEYQYGSVAEQTSSYQVKTYGRVFSFSREAIVNDDLGAIDAWTRAIGRLAAEFEAKMLVDLLTANAGTGPILADGLPLFHSSRGNVATGAGSALSLTSLSAARLAMRRQKGLDGEVVIDADPKFLVVPASLQTAAEQLVTQITPADPEKVNPFAGKLTPITEPRLDDSSATAWYAAADPQRIPTFEFAYLEGVEGPQTEQQWDFDRDVWKFKVRLDCGAGVVDWRGIYRAAGA
jgi:hypothetical protein